MKSKPIAVVGDFDPSNRSHLATNDAISHSAKALGVPVEYCWLGTDEVSAADPVRQLADFSGLWMAPASPYRSMEGALLAIRTARESRSPLLGTCGGFQHIVLEYARSVLGLADAEHEEIMPHASRLFISRLACSLVGRALIVTLDPGSLVARLYGRLNAEEEYFCNFGVNPDYVNVLRSGALQIVGSDDEGEARVVELAEHPFFIGTLFIPQLRSLGTAAHPLVSGFIKACLSETS
ncbi:MAG: CTP synthase C-terminal region-related (seleno)protein [Verrucomicrobiales bacterium]